jgi:hypothetical protein
MLEESGGIASDTFTIEILFKTSYRYGKVSLEKPNLTHTGGSLMNFYTGQQKFCGGIDLHARKMYLCALDEKGEVQLHRNMNTDRVRWEGLSPW